MTGDGQEGSEWDFDPDNDSLNLLILGVSINRIIFYFIRFVFCIL